MKNRAERRFKTKLVAEKRLRLRNTIYRDSYVYFLNYLDGKEIPNRLTLQYYRRRENRLIKYYLRPGYYRKVRPFLYVDKDYVQDGHRIKHKAEKQDFLDQIDELFSS
jgi:hypothetical protein